MSARAETYALMRSLEQRGITASYDDANTLRRAQLTLRRWYELECGDGNNYGSWAIERDDNGDGPPYLVRHHYLHGRGKDFTTRTRIPDREAGAVRRIAEVCKRIGINYYLQTDPRGCSLYADREPLQDFDYSRGVACCAARMAHAGSAGEGRIGGMP